MQITGQNPYSNYLSSSSTAPTSSVNSKSSAEYQTQQTSQTPSQEKPQNNTVANNDQLRQNLADYAGYQSKMGQAEIYIKGSTGNEVDLGKSTDSLVQGYLDAKKQNDAMNAYAGAGQL
jgi:hypothetical protein